MADRLSDTVEDARETAVHTLRDVMVRLAERKRKEADRLRNDVDQRRDQDSDLADSVDSNQPGSTPGNDAPPERGKDKDGKKLPYANPKRRPKYADGQVDDVWENAKNADGEVWVQNRDGDWYEVTWQPGQSRKGVWDMGHVPGEEYRRLHDDYMSHRISKEDFLERYRDADNYRVEDPLRNQSHDDEDHG